MQIQIHYIKKYKLRQKSQHKFHLANPAAMPVESQCGGTFLSNAFFLTFAFCLEENLKNEYQQIWYTDGINDGNHDENAED